MSDLSTVPSLLQAAPPSVPIIVKVAESKRSSFGKSDSWINIAILLIGAIVVVLAISRIIDLSQRVFEMESKPSVDDMYLKSVVKSQIDDTVKDMQAAAKKHHEMRMKQINELHEMQMKSSEAAATVPAASDNSPSPPQAAVEAVEDNTEAEVVKNVKSSGNEDVVQDVVQNVVEDVTQDVETVEDVDGVKDVEIEEGEDNDKVHDTAPVVQVAVATASLDTESETNGGREALHLESADTKKSAPPSKRKPHAAATKVKTHKKADNLAVV